MNWRPSRALWARTRLDELYKINGDWQIAAVILARESYEQGELMGEQKYICNHSGGGGSGSDTPGDGRSHWEGHRGGGGGAGGPVESVEVHVEKGAITSKTVRNASETDQAPTDCGPVERSAISIGDLRVASMTIRQFAEIVCWAANASDQRHIDKMLEGLEKNRDTRPEKTR